VDAVQDQMEISRLLYRYARAIDSRELDGLRSIFTEDAVIHYDLEGGTKLPVGEMIDWLRTNLRIFRATQHAISAPLVEIDGDRARSTCYLTAVHQQVAVDGCRTVFYDHGIYSDELVRSADGWRIRTRRLNRILMHGDFTMPDQTKPYDAPPEPVRSALVSIR